MTTSNIGITLSATDETKGAIGSALRGLDEMAKKSESMNSSFSGLSGSLRNSIQNASYQISDYVVQVQGGTSASRALAQQLPQLLAGFGAFGAVAGIVAGFAPQIIGFFKSGTDEAKPFADSLKDLNGVLASVSAATMTFDLKNLYVEFNAANAAARTGIVSLLEYKKTLAEVSSIKAEASIASDMKEIANLGTLDRLIGGDKAVDVANNFGIEIGVARDLLADARSGVSESSLIADRYATALAKGSDNGRKLAAALIDAAKGSRDAAAAQTAISEAMEKINKAGAVGKIPVDEKNGSSTKKSDYQALIESLNEKIAVQEADRASVETLNVAQKEYVKYQAELASGAKTLAKDQRAVVEAKWQTYLVLMKENDLSKSNKKAQALIDDYQKSNVLITERISREAELAIMTERQRTITEALYRTEDNGRAIRERILRDIPEETAQKIALTKAEEELAAQKEKVAAATAKSYDDQNSFAFGWTKAFQAYSDSASNAARSASDVFKQASSAMEDALVNFAMTGKVSFSSLANSIISDIVRMQAKAAVSGILGSLGSLFKSNTGNSGGYENIGGSGGSYSDASSMWANGGVFNSPSLSAYSGGVYNTPQPFAFAKGAGIFGEAGPEAIMPLKRGKDGKLGVSADSSSGAVTVNVINNGGGQTSTKERSDGRGNKIIDVIIEQAKNAIAADISSGNGSVPAAMSGAYGLRRSPGAY